MGTATTISFTFRWKWSILNRNKKQQWLKATLNFQLVQRTNNEYAVDASLRQFHVDVVVVAAVAAFFRT